MADAAPLVALGLPKMVVVPGLGSFKREHVVAGAGVLLVGVAAYVYSSAKTVGRRHRLLLPRPASPAA